MLYISLAKDELEFFDEVQERFPDNILVKTEHGFDMSSSVQVVIDISEILKDSLPIIVAAVEAVLLYRIQKQQNQLKEKELLLKGKELALEEEKANRAEFEIRYSSNGESQVLIKASDVNQVLHSPEKLAQLTGNLQKKLEEKNGQSKSNKKNHK